MYLGRGVSHTPSERFQRKRRDTPKHKNNHSPPPAASGGRMLLRPYIIGMSENKRSPAGGTGDLLELLNDGESIAGVLLDVGIGINLALGDG